MIYPCKCTHSFQDDTYGKGNRVHNSCKNGSKARCTVCLNERTISKEDPKKK